MPIYIRTKSAGATLFFTVRLANRNSNALVEHIDRLRTATRLTRTRYPFEIEEVVVLPAVIHTIWTLPKGDSDFSTRWRMLKCNFSRGLPAVEPRDPVTARRREKGIWQRRFWEHHLRDPEDIAAHRHMILSAPVQAGLVAQPHQWPHSSIHRAIRNGTYDPDQALTSAAYLPFASLGKTASAHSYGAFRAPH